MLEPGFSPGRFWEVVGEHGITFTVLLGAMSELLQQQAARPDDADNPLQMAPMAPLPSDAHGFRRRFGVDVAAVYGMTECGGVLYGAPHTIVGGEAGFAREGYRLRVVDEHGADEIKAVLVPRQAQHISPRELTGFLIDRLPYFMVPRYLEFAAELPKTPTQKVQKHLLREGTEGAAVWDREAEGIVLRRGD